MSSIEIVPTKVKWGKESFETDMVIAEGVTGFKKKLEGKTNVPTDRMKLMAKSKGLWKGVLKDEFDLTSLDLPLALKKSNPVQVLLMGSAVALVAPKAKTVFLEDLPPEEAAKALAEPAGLVNLGNTCYLNSVTQCLRQIPTFRRALKQYQPSSAAPSSSSLSTTPSNPTHAPLLQSLRDLYASLDRSGLAVPPAQFVMATKRTFPQFAQTNAQGQPLQQDAEEFFSALMAVFASETTGMDNIRRGFADTAVTEEDLNGAQNLVDACLGLKMEETLTCDEFSVGESVIAEGGGETMEVDNDQTNMAEPAVKTFDLHRKLVCNIQGGSDGTAATANVNHIHEGIVLSLNGKIEKHSEVLGRDAVWTRKQRIARLPPVLVVQFGRFYWKATPGSRDHAGVKCKIMKPVSFNDTLDVFDFCSESTQKILRVHRDAAAKEEEERLAAQGETKKEEEEGKDDTTMEDATDAPNDDDDDDEAAQLRAALQMSMEPEQPAVGPGLPEKFQGIYELFAVVTHKGRNADGGHYMGWVKADESSEDKKKREEEEKKAPKTEKKGEGEDLSKDSWFVFDDEEVSPCTGEDVMKLKGGGDYHMSYLNFYRARK